uniref:Uncharacterized protein n=1 Tax=Bursaphelenchus xylophilus TaxID=6326 RepID=A0A1I7SVJ1_BURXY
MTNQQRRGDGREFGEVLLLYGQQNTVEADAGGELHIVSGQIQHTTTAKAVANRSDLQGRRKFLLQEKYNKFCCATSPVNFYLPCQYRH